MGAFFVILGLLLVAGAVVALWPWSALGLLIVAALATAYGVHNKDALRRAIAQHRRSPRASGSSLSQIQRARIHDRLQNAPPCAFCKSPDRNVQDDLYRVDVTETRIHGATVPAVVLVCTGCGHIDLFAARRLLAE